MALRPSSDRRRESSLIEKSFDLPRSCLPFRAFCPIEGLRGLCLWSRRWIGGSDVYLPVGDGSIDGNNSRVVGWKGGSVSCIEGRPLLSSESP